MLSPADANLVRRDRDLPDLALVLDAEALAARFTRTLTGARIGGMAITYLRYKPGQSCAAGGRARVDGQPVNFVATAYRQDATGKRRKAATRQSVLGPFGCGRFVLNDSTVVVSVFPNDAKLDRLARLMLPDALTMLTARVRPLPAATVRMETLRYNPERRFVGRLMADDATLATVRCYTAQDYPGIAAKAGALVPRGPLRLARRLTRMHRFRLLAFEWLDGELLHDAMSESHVLPHTMGVVGQALAHLHGQHAPRLPRRTNASEAGAILALARHLAFLHPPLDGLALSLANRVAGRLQHEPADPRPLHGDFYAKQVLLNGAAVALIDLDEASLGDPAIDVARFRADLEAAAVSRRVDTSGIDALIEPMLTGYGLTLNIPAHLHVHAAAQLFRLAAHPFRRREPFWPDIATAILERAGTLLEGDTTTITVSRPERRQAARRASGSQGTRPARRPPRRVVDRFGVTNDPLMPFLAQALQPGAMAKRIARDLWGLGRATEVEVRGISVARYKPGLRCLIAYDLTVHEEGGATRQMAVMGKVRAQSADRSTHDLLETLWSGPFGACAGDEILVPEPLGVVSDLHMIAQRRVAGRSLAQLLEGPLGLQLARRAADAIHKLHRAAAPARRRHTVDDEIRILRQRLTRVAQERPRDEARIERLLEGCWQLAARVRDAPVCGIHRDFYPDQLLVDSDRLYLTDLDLYSEGAPALDVGNFVAHVEEHSLRRFGDPSVLAERNDVLIERYLQLSHGTTRAAIDVWTTLSLARHVAISTQFPDRRPFTAAILDLCEQRVFGAAIDRVASRVACRPARGARR
ncbi:MAG: phosphotransferase [Vicinamibacteraceae bacterium]